MELRIADRIFFEVGLRVVAAKVRLIVEGWQAGAPSNDQAEQLGKQIRRST
jgi:hypothetical protein